MTTPFETMQASYIPKTFHTWRNAILQLGSM